LPARIQSLPRLSLTIKAQFREVLAETLAAGGGRNCSERAAAIITVCDRLIVRYLLHEAEVDPEQVSRATAAAVEVL
jgi:hypothetical protein